MSNPYFTNTLDLIPGNRARASDVEANLSAVEAGFDRVAEDLSNYVRTNIVLVSANTQAVAGGHYVFLAAATLILPLAPTTNTVVGFANRSGTTLCVISGNDQPIMGQAEDMNLDGVNDYGLLIYVDSTRGWVLM